jgi:N-acetylmuramic acid 6-phosphate etherase
VAGGTVGGSNLMLVGREGLRKVVREIASKVPMAPQAIGAGFAGARGKKEMEMARGVLRQVWPRVRKVVVGQDTDSALGAAWGVEDGFLVIAGTGSNVVGRVKGKKYSAGGHGHVLGDAGSGYDLAQRAIRAVLRERDREGKAPALGATLMAHSGAADLDHLVREIYRSHGKEWLAGFAPGILRAAERGDPLACRVVRASALELAERAGELAKRVGVGRPRWALTGGLFQNGFYRQSFVRALRGIFSGAEVSVLKTSGEVGAARMIAGSLLRVGEEVDAKRPLVSVETLPTERTNPRSRGLHKKSVDQLVRLFVEEEAFTVRALHKARGEIQKAAEIVSRALQRGGRLFYVGAGTSGRLGVLDASEMPPTFHAPPEQVQAILAGGPEAIFRAQEGAEDDAEAGKRSVSERRVGKRDVLVGLTASGRTPFVHGALREGCRLGAATVLVTAHPNWSPVKGGVRPQAVVRLDVGPELIAGSTRLKAGTATKMVCNILSSVAMIRLGRVFDNLMVNVVPSNEKLHARAIQLVRALTQTSVEEARSALHLSGGKVTVAVQGLKKVSRLPRKR